MKNTIRKFHYALSNPPYQNTANQPVFQHFQTVGNNVAENTSMIYMASRWWYGTSGLTDFRTYMLNHPTLQEVYYFTEVESSQDIFDGTGIAGGVNIVTFQHTANTLQKDPDTTAHTVDGFQLIEHGTQQSVMVPRGTLEQLPIRASLIHIAEKIRAGMVSQNMATLYDRHESVVNEIGLSGSDLETLHPVQVASDAHVPAGRTKVYANISGTKGGRSEYYLIDTPANIVHKDTYTVCIGQSLIENENRPLRLFVFPPDTYFGRSAVSLARFDTLLEAEHFVQYASTRFFELCLRLSLAGRMKTFGNFVPDLQDYTESNTLIDWNAPLDAQLFQVFDLTVEEQDIVIQGLF